MGRSTSMTAVLFHVSSIGSALTMLYFARPGSSLFSWHPVLMTTAVGCLMSEGLMILTDDFSIVPISKRGSRVTLHWITQVAAIGTLYAGFVCVYVTKNQNAKAHFTSWHGYLGLVTLLLATSGSFGGNVLKYKIPMPFVSRKTIKSIHAVIGKTSLMLGCTVIALGLASEWTIKGLSGGLWTRCGVGAAALFTGSVVANEMRKIITAKMAAKKGTKRNK